MDRLTATLSGIGSVQGELLPLGVLHGSLTTQGKITASLAGVTSLKATLAGLPSIVAELTLPKGKASPAWAGEYTYTPTQSMQTIEIEGYKATQNITINPIPQNYGLITWNGSTITVS